MSDLNVVDGFEPPVQFSSITDIEFIGIASSENSLYSFYPVLTSDTEDLTTETTPAYIGVYITDDYENSCTGDCNVSGWYTFKRDTTIDVKGNGRYSEPIAWPSGTVDDTGLLSINETDVPESVRFYCVFLDGDNGAVGSGATDGWTSPANDDTNNTFADYMFVLQNGGANNFANYTLDNVDGGNIGYNVQCLISNFSDPDGNDRTRLLFNFDPPLTEGEENPPESINNPENLFDSLVVDQSTVTWDINDNELVYIGTIDPSDTTLVNVFGISSLDPNIIIFNFESATVPGNPNTATMRIVVGNSVLTVGENREFSTIQAAIDSSITGQTIIVSDGIYHEAINFKGKEIVVRGNVNNPENCIIDGINESGVGGVQAPWSRPSSRPELVSLVTVDTREPGQCYDNDAPNELLDSEDGTSDFTGRTLEGFTIQNGSAGTRYPGTEPRCSPCDIPSNNCTCPDECVGPESEIDCALNCANDKDGFVGGGLWVYRSYITVNDCIFRDNVSDGGGAVFARESLISFIRCTFENNTSKTNGGGVQFNHCKYTLDNCMVVSNTATGEGIGGTGVGGGIHVFGGVGTTRNTTIDSNTSQRVGGGMNMSIQWTQSFGDDPIIGSGGGPMLHVVQNCTIENNINLDEFSEGFCGGLELDVSSRKISDVPDGILLCSGTILCNNVRSSGVETPVLSNFCQQTPLNGEFIDGGGNTICDGTPEVALVIEPENFVSGVDAVEATVSIDDGIADNIKYKWYLKYRNM